MPWGAVSYACGMLIGLGIVYFLVRVPFQVSDNLGNMLAVQAASLGRLVENNLTARGYLRPLLWAQIKVLFEVAGGHYFVTFKAFHVAQILAVLLLFSRLVRVRSALDFAPVLLGYVVLIGIHTFSGTVREAFPVNTFMTILVCCLLAANLAVSGGGRWIDLTAVALLAYALLTVESGLLVWVILVVGYVIGLRGVSARALVVATGLVSAYFYLRFGPLGVGAPGLVERSSGFGFSLLDPPDLIRRFGDRPWVFYLYNVLCSLLTVLFSEPRAGVWRFTDALLHGRVAPWMLINVLASTVTTLIITGFAVRRLPRWVRGELGHDDRLVLLFGAVLATNATISYAYTKDVIMSPAGVFYALAAAVATRDALACLIQRTARVRVAVPLCFFLLLGSAAWSVRVVSLHNSLRYAAFVNRNDWATVYEWLAEQRLAWSHPEGAALVEGLRRQALRMPVPYWFFASRWLRAFLDPR